MNGLVDVGCITAKNVIKLVHEFKMLFEMIFRTRIIKNMHGESHHKIGVD